MFVLEFIYMSKFIYKFCRRGIPPPPQANLYTSSVNVLSNDSLPYVYI